MSPSCSPDGRHEGLVIPSRGPARRAVFAVADGRCRLPFGLPSMDAAAVVLPAV